MIKDRDESKVDILVEAAATKSKIKDRIDELSKDWDDDAKMEVSRYLARLAKSCMDLSPVKVELKRYNTDNFSATTHAVAVSTTIANTALSEYNAETDGDLFDYLTWFIQSAQSMIAVSHGKNIHKDSILEHPKIFFRKIAWYSMHGKKRRLAYWGIVPKRVCLKRCMQIAADYGF